MSANGKKRSRKSKLVPRTCMDSDEEDLQPPKRQNEPPQEDTENNVDTKENTVDVTKGDAAETSHGYKFNVNVESCNYLINVEIEPGDGDWAVDPQEEPTEPESYEITDDQEDSHTDSQVKHKPETVEQEENTPKEHTTEVDVETEGKHSTLQAKEDNFAVSPTVIPMDTENKHPSFAVDKNGEQQSYSQMPDDMSDSETMPLLKSVELYYQNCLQGCTPELLKKMIDKKHQRPVEFKCTACKLTFVVKQAFYEHLCLYHYINRLWIKPVKMARHVEILASERPLHTLADGAFRLHSLIYKVLLKFKERALDGKLQIWCYKCYVCERSYDTYRLFFDHMMGVGHPKVHFTAETLKYRPVLNLIATTSQSQTAKPLPLYDVNGKEIFKCLHCKQEYEDATALSKHKKFVQCVCKKSFSCLLYKNHMGFCKALFHYGFPKTCNCGAECSSKEQLVAHRAKCKTNVLIGFKCIVCEYLATTLAALVRHQQETHCARSDEPTLHSAPKACAACRRLYSGHAQTHCCPLAPRRARCPHCERRFASDVFVRVHLAGHAQAAPCARCGDTLPRACMLPEHSAARHGGGAAAYRCDVCDHVALDRRRAIAHAAQHDPEAGETLYEKLIIPKSAIVMKGYNCIITDWAVSRQLLRTAVPRLKKRRTKAGDDREHSSSLLHSMMSSQDDVQDADWSCVRPLGSAGSGEWL